jgi:hypothetical protein
MLNSDAMKNLKTVICFVVFLLGATALDCAAQLRSESTASARAYYGYPTAKPKMKLKKRSGKKIPNYTHTLPAKGTQHSRVTRRKYTAS